MSKKTKRNANYNKYNHGYKNTHNYKESPELTQSYWPGDSQITTHIRYLQWKLRIVDI
jgi:hypothetical protein